MPTKPQHSILHWYSAAMKQPKAAPVLPLTHEYITCLRCGFVRLWRISGQVGDCYNCNCGSWDLHTGEIKIKHRHTDIRNLELMANNHTGQRIGLIKYLQAELNEATTIDPYLMNTLCERLAPRYQKRHFEVRRAIQFVLRKNKQASSAKPQASKAT